MSGILHTYVPKVKYSKIQGKPYITVSAKGISNGLSDTYNDGADFGPDTLLNATSPNQYGPPYTNTYGIQEAVNYANNNNISTVKLLSGTFTWLSASDTVSITQTVSAKNVQIIGSGYQNTIIKINDSSLHYNVPFYLYSNTRISGISFIMSYNNNQYYTPSSIIIMNPSSYVEIDHCSFDQQAVAWYIQFLATFNSSSPPTGYITDVRIHDNIIHANIQESGTNESIVVDNADGVEIFNNYFYTDNTTSNAANAFINVYDYARNVSVHDNYFEVTGPSAVAFVIFQDALNCEFVNNVVYSTLYNSGTPVLGVFNATKYLKIANNIVYGANFGTNLNTFGVFVSFGLGPQGGAVQNGAGGPDGNVSQNAGWNDFITIENNVVIGVYVSFTTAFSGYQNFTFLKVEGNVWGSLRVDSIPSGSIMSQNWGTIIYRNNIQIGDLLIGPGAVGTGSPWFELAGTSSYTIENAIIEGNRFPYVTAFASSTALNNVTLQYITNLIFRNNLLGGSGQNSVGITNYLNVSNVSQAVIEDNWAIDKTPNVPVLSASVAGTTAGTVYVEEINYRTNYKKATLNLSGYENDTTTNQIINFPLPFSTTAAITANNTGLTISASTSGITITAPNSTTTYSGIVIVEGY